MLENMVKHLEGETQDLQQKLNSLRHNNVPSIHQSSPSFQNAAVPFTYETRRLSDLMRAKRSNDEVRSDRKDRKKSKFENFVIDII